MPSVPRSLLFVPASRPDFAAKASRLAADVVILDLEDGVAPIDKVAARIALPELTQLARAGGAQVWVRINGQHSAGDEDLLAAAKLSAITAIMLPKAEQPAKVHDAGNQLRLTGSGARLVPLVETPAGLSRAGEIAACDEAVAALAFGSEDFAAALGVRPAPVAMALPAQLVVLAAASVGLPAYGLPGSLSGYRDLSALRSLGEMAAQIGFAGAMCVHPAQVPIISRCFTPSPEDIAWAQQILVSAAGAQGGAGSLAGQMIDKPVIEQARRMLDRQV